MFSLIPVPHKIKTGKKSFPLYGIENLVLPDDCSTPLLNAAVSLADDFEKATAKRLRFSHTDLEGGSIVMDYDPAIVDPEGYMITGNEKGILIEASTEAGLFYGIQTLRQIVATCDNFYPNFDIEDAPDFDVRGFYHDVTRGNVPTLDTLFKLADKMAYYKLNQLQLYIEHTFAFARHCDVWAGADPLTAEEIIRLDHYCNERHIDLVPSLSTFGHFYMALRSKRKEDLNELDIKASEKPFSFHDRMAHYTLNCTDKRSIELIEDMLDEFMPLFSSTYFNICCDETFDLGKGKNAEKAQKEGADSLYVDFLKKIIDAVEKRGAKAMFWGDIIGEKPELLKSLPDGTIPLEWDYGRDAAWHDTAALAKVAEEFYVCPGCCGWNRWSNGISHAQSNIWKYAKKGLGAGAAGLLNTNWGDAGNINMLANSYHGLAFGAAAGWNVAAAGKYNAFDDAFDVIELGCKGFTALWKAFTDRDCFTWGFIQRWIDPSCNGEINDYIAKTPYKDMVKILADLEKALPPIMAKAPSAHPADKDAMTEIIFGLEMTLIMHKTAIAMVKPQALDTFMLADEIRKMEQRFSLIWHKRAKPSEYFRVKDILLKIADKLDMLQLNNSKKTK